MLTTLAVAAFASLLIAGAAWRARALTLSGAGAASVVGFLVFGAAGWPGAVTLLLFFVTSSALSRLGKRRKATIGFEKGSRRDAGQVFANGGACAACAALLWVVPPVHAPVVIAALLGAIAEANADTWATEWGSLAGRTPRLITTLRPAPVGASGAVSLPGTVAALCGATLVAAVALVWPRAGVSVACAALAGGFAGSLADSLLGATVQRQYRCAACDHLTETPAHCDVPALPARGLAWVGNDAVNFAATLFGATVAAGLLWYR